MEFRTLMAGRLPSDTSLLMVRDETDRKSAASSGVRSRTGFWLVIAGALLVCGRGTIVSCGSGLTRGLLAKQSR